MDLGRSFTYMFDDEEWVGKMLLGSLFTLLSSVLVGIPFLLGYGLAVIRNVTEEEERPLPQWTNLGDMFGEGLMVFIIAVVYSLPAIAVSFFGGLVGAVVSQNTGDAFGIFIACLNCLAALWSILVAAVLPAAVLQYANTRDIGSAFRFGEIFQIIGDNLGDYVIVIVVSWVASFIASFGVILCFIGVLFTSFWALLVYAHLLGQFNQGGAVPAAGEAGAMA